MSEFDVCRRQILTYNDRPRTEKVTSSDSDIYIYLYVTYVTIL